MSMPDFPIDPELCIRASPLVILRRTTEAIRFIRKMTLSQVGHGWRHLLESFEAAQDEWSAMEAVVRLELLLEAEAPLGNPKPLRTAPRQHCRPKRRETDLAQGKKRPAD